MANHDPRIDAYIAKSAEFARPILEHLRARARRLPRGRGKHQVEHAVLQLQGGADVHDGGVQAALQLRLLAVEGGHRRQRQGRHGPVRQARLAEGSAAGEAAHRIPEKGDGTERSRREEVAPESRRKARADPAGRPGRVLAQKKHAAARKSWTKASVPAHSASTSTGSSRQKPMPLARNASPPRWSGWPKASDATGNTKNAEAHLMGRLSRDDPPCPLAAVRTVAAERARSDADVPPPSTRSTHRRSPTAWPPSRPNCPAWMPCANASGRRLQHYPWLVWEEAGEVLAYAYAGRFRERAAYDWIAETSIYVRADAHRRGIARQLYGVLLDVMRLQGINQAVGVITLPGTASVAMHETMGFCRCRRMAPVRLQARAMVGCGRMAKAVADACRLAAADRPVSATWSAPRDFTSCWLHRQPAIP